MKKPNVKWTLIVGVIIVGLAAVGLTNSIGSAQNTPNSNSENPQGSTSSPDVSVNGIDVKNEVPAISNNNTAENQEIGYLPIPFSLKDEAEVKKVIQDYYNAIDQKDFSQAYDKWAQPLSDTKEAIIASFQSSGIEHVKIVSMEKYIWPINGVREKVADNVPSPYFFVVLDYKGKEPYPTNIFPDIRKDKTGEWKIYNLCTSGIPSEL